MLALRKLLHKLSARARRERAETRAYTMWAMVKSLRLQQVEHLVKDNPLEAKVLQVMIDHLSRSGRRLNKVLYGK